MTLEVDGFPGARDEVTQTGVKVLSTVRQGSPQDPIRAIRIHVRGLPTAGPERQIAVVAALAGAAGGLFLALRAPGPRTRSTSSLTRAKIRARLIEEIQRLEAAHRAGEVGPKAYARERAKLIDRLADALEPDGDDLAASPYRPS
jgi:hypothetical protein